MSLLAAWRYEWATDTLVDVPPVRQKMARPGYLSRRDGGRYFLQIRLGKRSAALYALDCFVHHKNRNEEPFARDHWIAEPIFDFDVQPRGVENPMDNVFQLRSVNVVKFIGGDDFHIGHKEGRIKFRVRNAPPNVPAGYPDLVKNITVADVVAKIEKHQKELKDSYAPEIVKQAVGVSQRTLDNFTKRIEVKRRDNGTHATILPLR
jgi:hypothetical protein